MGLILVLFLIPMGLSMYASMKTRNTFNKYSRVPVASGMTGREAAQRMLASAGINDVEVVSSRGMLTDHYNPMTKKLALSEPVYNQRTVAAVGVACHEAGHAIQHSKHYAPLWLRSMLVPTANLGGRFSNLLIMGGFVMAAMGAKFAPWLILAGIVGFSAVVLFQGITLPVEFDASKRAKEHAFQLGIVSASEREGVDKVLDAAALTYVAAAIGSIMTLLYYVVIFLGLRRD
jgi:Zn-dependent membrane protease YugP